MCECGCGEFRPIVKMPAPDGWYAIEIYSGCEGCGTDWTLTIAHIKPGGAGRVDRGDELTLEDTPEAVFDAHMSEWHQRILDTEILRKEFAKSVEGDDETDDMTAEEISVFSFDEFVNRGGLIDVFRKTLSATDQRSVPGQEADR